MRIAYLNPRSAMGGAEVALLNIVTAIRQAQPDWQISLMTPDDGPLVARAHVLGVQCKMIPFPNSIARLGDSAVRDPAGREVSRLSLLMRLLLAAPAVVATIVRLRRALRSINPEIIHTNGFKMHVLGALAKPAGIPLIWHVHDYVSTRPLMSRMIKLLRNRCTLILANSDSVKQDIKAACGNDAKVQTLYNAVDPNVFSPEGDLMDLDALSGLASNGSGEPYVRIGLLATFGRWKGHDVFLHALSMLPADIHWRAYVIGDAVYVTDGSQFSREELQKLARQLGISDRVGFTGFVDQPAAAIRALDIVVHASTQPEPFGLTIVEAMSCGRPVIVSDAGGAAELIQSDTNGARTTSKATPAESAQIALSHTPGNAEELAARITELVKNDELREHLVAEGRASVDQRYSSVELNRRLVSVYQSIA